jgi:hypothetical protein
VINERQRISDAIYDWVAAVVAEEGRTDPVVWDHGDGPRPKPPFISLEFTGTSTPGTPNYSPVDENGERSITRSVRRALTMYAFGEGALDLLETVKESIWKDAYQDMLAKEGLVIPQTLEVRENPTAHGVDTEYSAFFEFYVTYMRVTKESMDWIDTVEITPRGKQAEKIIISVEEEK